MNPDEYFAFLLGNFNDQFNHVETINPLDQAHKSSALGLLVLELVKRVERLRDDKAALEARLKVLEDAQPWPVDFI